MRLWPILCGVNLWLVALGVPLVLAARTASPFLWAMAPLSPLCLAIGMRLQARGFMQGLLLLGVPLLALLPGADGTLADSRLLPRPAVGLSVALCLGYLITLCRFLAQKNPPKSAAHSPPEPPHKTVKEQAAQPWHLEPWHPSANSEAPRLFRRVWAQRLLTLYAVAVPLLVLYAVDVAPAHLFALRSYFGPPRRVAAVQATLSSGLLLLCSILFYFCIMSPLASYLDHHRQLRTELHGMRRQARRGRPRRRIYAYMLSALVGMILLIFWSLQR